MPNKSKPIFGTALVFNNAVALFIHHQATLDEFDWLMGINLNGVVYGTRLPMMLALG
jgi:hypothetical protein